MRFLRLIGILAALLLQSLPTHGDAVVTNVMSPVVSYQYPDDFGNQASTNGGMMSPVVGYQYFEWPGDSIVRSQRSPVVSYFLNVSLPGTNVEFNGCVFDTNGAPVTGATVSATVMDTAAASATTARDGGYSLSALPPGVYVVGASLKGFISDRRVVVLSATTARQDFRLKPFPSASATTTISGPPPFALPPALEGSVLSVFDGVSFVPNLALIRTNRMTVVLTHGWNPPWIPGSPTLQGSWPGLLAASLQVKGVGTRANIVAWDWLKAATAALPPTDKTPDQGLGLGIGLYQALGSNYVQNVHFIGHSLGTLVNAAAADFLHGNARGLQQCADPHWNSTNTHITLLDEAELAVIAGRLIMVTVVSGAVGLSAPSLGQPSAATGYVSPIPMYPANYGWIDNYISAMALCRSEAVNVCLQQATGLFDGSSPFTSFESFRRMHDYPATSWYPESIRRSGAGLMGFTNSFERQAMSTGSFFPPRGSAYQAGQVFRQLDAPTDLLVVEPVDCVVFSDYSAPYEKLLHSAVIDWRMNPAEFKLNTTIGAARIAGSAAVNMFEDSLVKVGEGVNYLVDRAQAGTEGILDLLNSVGLRLELKTTGAGENLKAGTLGKDTNILPCVWLPVVIPTQVTAMAFDFTVTGDGQEDRLAFGISATNLFNLGVKFIPQDQVTTSGLMDVSTWAGSTNELFFGILGGTSTNCSVRVDAIRFYTLSPPKLLITQSNGLARLSWPSTAVGFGLQTTTNLAMPAWMAVTSAPSLFDGQIILTNQVDVPVRFFRLQRN